MQKDFNKWNDKKDVINGITEIPNFHEREIWICFIGLNIGFEQDGAGDNFQRPVVIIKKFNKDTCLIIPLSTTNRRGRYYFAFMFESNVTSVAVLSQIRFIDASRLSFMIGYINEDDFNSLMKKFKALLP